MNHDTTGAKHRPSLFADPRSAGDDIEERDHGPVSILSCIEAPPCSSRLRSRGAGARRRRAMRLLWPMVLTAVTAALVGWLPNRQDGMELGADAAQQGTPAPGSHAPAPDTWTQGDTGDHKVAVIEMAAGPAATRDVSPGMPGSAIGTDGISGARGDERTGAAAPDAEDGMVPPAAVADSLAQATPTQRRASAHPAARPAKAASPRDPDVDLLEALVSHVAGSGRGRAAPAPTPRLAAPPDAGPARDVVLQQDPPLPTGELVQRCMQLGGLEARLCRARICSGLWGRDPACPASSHADAEVRP